MFELVSQGEDYQVDYDKERGVYRFSLFKDNHFVDEWFFDEAEKENNDVKKELLSMYEDSLKDATSMWVSEYSYGKSDEYWRLQKDKENIEKFNDLLEKLWRKNDDNSRRHKRIKRNYWCRHDGL